MPTEREDEDWARRQLSAEADRFDLDLDGFRARVMAEMDASTDGQAAAGFGAAGFGAAGVGAAGVGAAGAGDPSGPRPGRWRRLGRARRTGRSPRPVRLDPRPRLAPAAFAAAAVVVAIAVVGSVAPGVRAWGGDERGGDGPGTAQVTGEAPVSDTPSPTQTVSLGPRPPSLSASASTPATGGTPTGSGSGKRLPSSFRWNAGGALISAKSDTTHEISEVRDPSVVFHDGRWHVFATAAGPSIMNLVYLSFADWGDAGSATQYYLDQSGIGAGYRAAPEVFYFAPQKLWYLVYQTGNASYSTNPDLSDPHGWSAPKDFYPGGMPDLIRRNVGDRYWVDMWVICDDADCHLFSTDQQGQLYRSQTTVASFPDGMSQPVIALQDANPANLLDASSVYKVSGTNQYLLLVEAIGADGRAYFRSWTSTSLGGTWTPLAATEANPFAGMGNTTFTGTAWARDIGQGELVRDSQDQTLRISPCNLRYLYLGGSKLGLLSQTDSACS